MPQAFMLLLILASMGVAVQAAEPTTAQADSPKRYVVDASGARAKPAVAAADVCAFPYIIPISNGSIVALIFNQPSHGRLPGDVDCWGSTDGGASWQRRGTVAPHEPGTMTQRMTKSLGLLQNGELLAICSGWTLIPKPNALGELDVDRQLPPIAYRSADGGYTWTADENAFPPKAPTGLTHNAWGVMQIGQDDALHVVSYEFDRQSKWRTVRIWKSIDLGRTWGDPVMLDASRNMNETSLLHMGDGKWLAVARDAGLDLYRSDDDARTWRRVGPVTEPKAIPGTLLKLADGRILLSNGNRTEADERCEVRISADRGATFSAPVRLVDFITFDGGYPCSVQRPDGQIVTAYYAKKTSCHDGYHMGVVIWDPAKTFPR